jgi:pimeloyl-ACP methyl ester carboxylesterase
MDTSPNRIKIDGKDLEYSWHGPLPTEALTLVFLHEGLGSVAMWRDFPARVAEASGFGALVYSRAGYGNSDLVQLPWSVRFMHDEALTTLPLLLDAMEIRETVLVGHSDGGSIALIHAGAKFQDSRVRGLILEAPHVFVEEVTVKSIDGILRDYREGNLRRQLQHYHGEKVDEVFWGWSNVWLDPAFRAWNIEEYLGQIRVPMLLLQGREDQYGTLAQVRSIEEKCAGFVRTVLLDQCGHDPHFDQPERTFEEIVEFLRRFE